MNEYLKRLLKYCDDNMLTITRFDVSSNNRVWDLVVTKNKQGIIVDYYYNKQIDKWDFE